MATIYKDAIKLTTIIGDQLQILLRHARRRNLKVMPVRCVARQANRHNKMSDPELASGKFCSFFRRVRKTARSHEQLRHVMSVCPSAWNNSVSTGRIFMKLAILVFFRKSVEKIPVVLKSDKNNGHFTWRPKYIFFHHISLNYSYHAKFAVKIKKFTFNNFFSFRKRRRLK